tara:strand:- start:2732 stop:2965 length:234 start_codon:yes stop_codon:yes gene_type:complete
MGQFIKTDSDVFKQAQGRIWVSWSDATKYLRAFMHDQELCETLIARQEALHSNEWDRFVMFIQDQTQYTVSVYAKGG